jgi:alanine racemase
MNLCCCEGNDMMEIWDEIWLIENQKNSPLNVQHIAGLAETIPYEILVRLDRGIRRVVE